MGRSNKKLLVHKHMETINVTQMVDIVLTPQFYTFLREELAIKFAYQAKNIAQSLFDDYLDSTKKYQYHTYRCGESWCFFAYNIEEITSFLESRGVKPYLVGKIYFAQELAKDLNQPIQLSSDEAMQTIEGTVTIIPKRLMSSDEQYQNLNLDKSTLKNAITISSAYDSVVPLKQTLFITILLLLLGGSFIFEGARIKASIANNIATQESLLSKNPKLSSSLIRNSELKKYQPINAKERLKRNTVTQISKMLSSKSTLKELLLNEKTITATIKTTNTATTDQIEQQAKANKFKIKSKEKNQIVMEKKL